MFQMLHAFQPNVFCIGLQAFFLIIIFLKQSLSLCRTVKKQTNFYQCPYKTLRTACISQAFTIHRYVHCNVHIRLRETLSYSRNSTPLFTTHVSSSIVPLTTNIWGVKSAKSNFSFLYVINTFDSTF